MSAREIKKSVNAPWTKPDLVTASVAILAGGLGTRLRAAVADRPKVLAEVGGRPFLAYLLDQLIATGMTDVVLCTGYLGDQIRDVFGESYLNLRLAYCREPQPLGTAGALRLALPLFRSDPVLVMNGDSYCAANLKTFWDWHWARRAKATLLLAKASDTTRYGHVRLAADGAVAGFAEKGGGRGAGWVNAGVYLLDRDLLCELPTGRAVSLELDVFPRWVGRGLCGFCSEARFIDIGTPEAYGAAERFFKMIALEAGAC